MGVKPRRPGSPGPTLVPDMAAAPVPAPVDDFGASIKLAQQNLKAAVRSAPMQREPYQLILAAQSSVIGVFESVVPRWEKAVADVIAARDPLPPEERASLVRELVAATEDGAFKAMRKEAARVVRTLDHGVAVRIGLAIGGAYIAGALSVWGFILFRG